MHISLTVHDPSWRYRPRPRPLQHSSSSRLINIASHLRLNRDLHTGNALRSSTTSISSATDGLAITIGDISVNLPPRNQLGLRLDLIPVNYADPMFDSQEMLEHLRWMLQKHQLKQDMFLIGPPGPERRRLAMRFAEIAQLEVEYLCITRDTSEADLKQRREIRKGTIEYVDQAPVRAAIHGRLLIVEGIEKAERNVLPTLNNLLENREMALDDGRFLLNAQRFDTLQGQTVVDPSSTPSKKATDPDSPHIHEHTSDKVQLVRVHPDFRVIALGLPVPRFPGYLLDPPLRSRFQARSVTAISLSDRLSYMGRVGSYKDSEQYRQALHSLLGLREALTLLHRQAPRFSTRMPLFADTAVDHIASFLRVFPPTMDDKGMATIDANVFRRSYPFDLICDEAQLRSVAAAMERFHIRNTVSDLNPHVSGSNLAITTISTNSRLSDLKIKTVNLSARDEAKLPLLDLQFEYVDRTGNPRRLSIPCAGGKFLSVNGGGRLIDTAYHQTILSAMLQDHACGRDLCIVGDKGCGKSAIVRQFAAVLGYDVYLIHAFKDMSSRDLLQQRTTESTGDTSWKQSDLINAACSGALAILDGVDRLPASAVAALRSLIEDRDCVLFDGSHLLRWDRYDALAAKISREMDSADSKEIHEVLRQKYKMYRISPQFRVIALALPPSKSNRWLTEEIMGLFSFITMTELSSSLKNEILCRSFPAIHSETVSAVLNLAQRLTELSFAHVSVDDGKRRDLDVNVKTKAVVEESQSRTTSMAHASHALNLSLRQLLRIVRRCTIYPEDLQNAVRRCLLARFLPSTMRVAFETVMSQTSTTNASSPNDEQETRVRVEDGGATLNIGGVRVKRLHPERPELVPQVLFYEIPNHVAHLKDMLKDWVCGDRHMLLIGNQGVGKNKLADYLLQLVQAEREYVQLHRDTTVQSLTIAPTLVGGCVVYEDSPLVRAARFGRVLVVDEADKAPLEVVSILKGLLEDGEMTLGDGRKIIDPVRMPLHQDSKSIIQMHPNFRVIVLANRPGYPFLGNDFFRECGDVLSCHVIDNPDPASELLLLRSYAPHVDTSLLTRLVDAFGTLRALVEEGVFAYPYSTRELVAIARHLEHYPQDGLLKALGNVLSFDLYDNQTVENLHAVFHQHGIPLFLEANSASGIFLQKNAGTGGVQLAPSKPLMPPEPLGQWRVMSNSVGTDKVAQLETVSTAASGPVASSYRCQVNVDELSPLSKMWTVDMRSDNSVVEWIPGRFSTFSELVLEFRVPINPGGRVLGMTALADHSLYILVTRPLAVYCFSASSSYRQFSIMPIDDLVPVHITQEQFIQLVRFPALNQIGLYMPTHSVILVVSVPSKLNSTDGTGVQARAQFFPITLAGAGSSKTAERTSTWSAFGFSPSGFKAPYNYNKGGGVETSAGPTTLDSSLSNRSQLLLWQAGSPRMCLFDFSTQRRYEIMLPAALIKDGEAISECVVIDKNCFIITTTSGRRFVSSEIHEDGNLSGYTITPILEDGSRLLEHRSLATGWVASNVKGNHPSVLLPKAPIGMSLQVTSKPPYPAMMSQSPIHLSRILVPHRDVDLPASENNNSFNTSRAPSIHIPSSSSLFVLPYAFSSTPNESASKGPRYMAVIDMANDSVHYLDISTDTSVLAPGRKSEESSSFSDNIKTEGVGQLSRTLKEMLNLDQIDQKSIPIGGNNDLVSLVSFPSINKDGPLGADFASLESSGVVRLWQVDREKLATSLKAWKSLFGSAEKERPLRLEISAEKGREPSMPKHGREDETNAEHVGGNTWAGGSGGADTAGLGGVGGPYRQDSGHDVHQISDDEKSKLSEEALKAARELAKAELARRLNEIEMAPHENAVYRKYLGRVSKEVHQLRLILESVEAKQKEREWLRHQSQGDLDDAKLVDGAVGEKQIYRRRGVAPSPAGLPQQLPKRLHFLLDVSGSMYRFNGTDGRLDRLLEAALLIMESFAGFEHKYSYTLVGHSGDGPAIPFVEYGLPPVNERDRLKILEKMHAHSQYCQSGDSTLFAVEEGMKDVVSVEADDHMVFLVSDANLRRYGVTPGELATRLTAEPKVNAFAIFIASLDDQASRLVRQLPAEHGFICHDVSSLPHIFRTIFTSHFSES